MADRDVRGAERPSRSRLEGTLANHVTVHVTATYKVERATTQPDPSSSRIVSSSSSSSLFPFASGPLPGLASTRRDADRILLLRPTAAAAVVGARCPPPAAGSCWTR